MSQSHINRREFLKLLGMSSLLFTKLSWDANNIPPQYHSSNQRPHNIFFLLFDALSARNMSLYGYPRRTTPNLERFAQRATVYHRHYAGGNFTSPGTASLLTGTYPWSHRAYHIRGAPIKPFSDRNIFSSLTALFHTFAYTHNPAAYLIIEHFREHIDQLTKISELGLAADILADKFVLNDDYRIVLEAENSIRRGRFPGSPFLNPLNKTRRALQQFALHERYRATYPFGMPRVYIDKPPAEMFFTLQNSIDWIKTQLLEQPQPFLGYVHLYPPHSPYAMRSDFFGRFDDGWQPIVKPEHFFSGGHSQERLKLYRRYYDEYIANLDVEFGHLFDFMQQNGILDNTYFIITSDHGEMFERGILAHGTPTLYEPIIHIPLLISKPGQGGRQNIFTPTNCVDLLPTFLHVNGLPIPDWCEGQVLPSFNHQQDETERSIYTVEAQGNSKYAPLKKGTVALVKGRFKFIHYFGYEGYKHEYELYDLESDPEELVNLYDPADLIACSLKQELADMLAKTNQE